MAWHRVSDYINYAEIAWHDLFSQSSLPSQSLSLWNLKVNPTPFFVNWHLLFTCSISNHLEPGVVQEPSGCPLCVAAVLFHNLAFSPPWFFVSVEKLQSMQDKKLLACKDDFFFGLSRARSKKKPWAQLCLLFLFLCLREHVSSQNHSFARTFCLEKKTNPREKELKLHQIWSLVSSSWPLRRCEGHPARTKILFRG